jgi:DNA protecting protein DprA
MQTHRIPSRAIRAFETFDGYRIPEFLDVQSLSGNSSLLDDLPDLGLGVVGTRHPQKRSLDLLERVMADLRGTRLIVISGFARGIDSAAHALALKNGLRTIAILGCGIDIDYPRENRRLRHQILDAGGLILSPFESHYTPIPRNFLERNGLIAGFSKATWVVEAAAVSGTLNTATWATKFNRSLYATSCFPSDPFFEGNEKLLSQRRTDRYPVAELLFGAHSLGSTWPDLVSHSQNPHQLSFKETSLSTLQRWVRELTATYGECHVQALLTLAHENGVSPGQFYLSLESEIAEGLLRRDDCGRIKIGRNGA